MNEILTTLKIARWLPIGVMVFVIGGYVYFTDDAFGTAKGTGDVAFQQVALRADLLPDCTQDAAQPDCAGETELAFSGPDRDDTALAAQLGQTVPAPVLRRMESAGANCTSPEVLARVSTFLEESRADPDTLLLTDFAPVLNDCGSVQDRRMDWVALGGRMVAMAECGSASAEGKALCTLTSYHEGGFTATLGSFPCDQTAPPLGNIAALEQALADRLPPDSPIENPQRFADLPVRQVALADAATAVGN